MWAAVFLKYYGGNIAIAYAALELFARKQSKFNPFHVITPKLHRCLKDSNARGSA